MLNSTLTGNARVWFDDLYKETIDSYDDLKKAFLENYLQLKKCIKDPVEIHNIRQRDGESTEEFMRRHGITNTELCQRYINKIPKSVDEMMRVTTAFLRREVAASNHERKKPFSSWKQQEANQKKNFKKVGFRNQQRSERKQDRFSLLTKTLKEIFTLDKGKFKAPPPKTTPVEKRNHAKFCEFHGEVGHNKDEWIGTAKVDIRKEKKLPGKDKALLPNGSTFGKGWLDKGLHRVSLPIQKSFFHPWGKMKERKITVSVQWNYWKTRSHKLQAVPSTAHGMLKIPMEGGVITLKSSKLVPPECAVVSRPEETSSATKPIIEERVKVAINPEYLEQTVMIGSTLTEGGRNKLCGLLQRNLNIFACKPADMTGVPRHIAEHRLNVREGCSPVRQKKRGQAADRNQAIQEEVGKLVEAGIMKEVHYHDWLSNPVMVKKHDDSWRMCVDFKDLNKACPKDGYPLPEID
ncbi:reverse transcriptase domain-containing protein [Tanacetum coccineum]